MSAERTLRVLTVMLVFAVACDVEVTTLGAVTASSVNDDAGTPPDVAGPHPDADASLDVAEAEVVVDAPGAWTSLLMPTGINNFRSVWLPRPDEPWVLGIDTKPSIIGAPDGGFDSISSGEGGSVSFHGVLLRRVGGTWSTLELSSVVNAVWGSTPDRVWVVGDDDLIVQTDGIGYSTHSPDVLDRFTAVWGTDADHVWVAGHDWMLRWNPTALRWMNEPLVGGYDSISALWGSSDHDVWAVSTSGWIRHFDGTAWSVARDGVGLAGLDGVWGTGADDAWAVGEQGTILHWDGHTWTTTLSPTIRVLSGVWGSSKNDVWFVGEAGTILHWDGTKLAPFASPTTADLSSVGGTSATSAWAVGNDHAAGTGVMLRYQK